MKKTKKELEAEIKELKAKLSAKKEPTCAGKEAKTVKEVKTGEIVITVVDDGESETIEVASKGLTPKGMTRIIAAVAKRLILKEMGDNID